MWRIVHEHAIASSSHRSSSEFVVRMASLYSIGWTAARRDARLNLLLYAVLVAVRGRARTQEPPEEVLGTVDVFRARVQDIYDRIFDTAKAS